MQIEELAQLLNAHPNDELRFVLPSGSSVPAHFHITEVGRFEKSFIDCGGTNRTATTCTMQIWTANDTAHRLQCGKLGKIIALASKTLQLTDLPAEIEYGPEVASLYTIDHCVAAFGTVQVYLAGKQTDCLAKDKCGVNGCDDANVCCT